MNDDKSSVFLRDCRAQLFVGVYDHERHAPQNVLVSVEAEMALTERFDDVGEKSTARVVSYEMLYDFVRSELPKMGHIYLLESVAESIITFCFRDPRILSVTVRLEKPDIFPAASAGISMTRRRT